MRFSHLATVAAFSALTTAQSDDFSIEKAWEELKQPGMEQGRNYWTTAFSSKSGSKTHEEVNATSDNTYTNAELFHDQYFGLHNQYREEHNASKLEWNETLAIAAQEHAEKCIFEHTENNPYGENLVAGYANMSAAMAAWADERDMYNFDDGKFNKETGHFTQMVWKNTTQVGCGRCFCGGGKQETGGDGTDKAPGWMVVCEYSPQGNVENQFKDNVVKGNYEKGAASGLVAQSGLAVAAAVGVLVLLM